MKNNIYIKIIIFATILISILIFILSFTLLSNLNENYQYFIISISSFLVFFNFIVLIYFSLSIKKKRQLILNKFDSYIENEISKIGSGALIMNDFNEIIWSSNFLEERLNVSLVGKKVSLISPNFKKNFEKQKKFFIFKINEIFFEAKVNYLNKIIILKDITSKVILENQYKKEQLVIGEMEIDNFRQLQSLLSEEEIFKVQTLIINKLDDLIAKYNISYRQYVQGKFLIFLNKNSLDNMKKNNFDFLEKLSNSKIAYNNKVTVSIGFGLGTVVYKDLIELAKDGLIQSISRGGNQVTINIENEKPEYYGSKSEIDYSTSRVQVNQIAKLIEEKLNSSKIKKVIIYGHKIADLDAIGAALGMYYISTLFDKEAYIQIQTYDDTTFKTLFNNYEKNEINKIFISKNKANKITSKNDTLIIIVDTAYIERTENPYAYQNINMNNVFILDHHRVSKMEQNLNKNNLYIDSKASSTSEIVTEILRFVKKTTKIDKKITQFLLNGIYLDTNQFTKATSSKTFSAASWLERHGANSNISSNVLKIPEDKAKLIANIMALAKEIKPGFFLSVYEKEVPEDIISIAADEMLRIEGRKATFVIAQLPGKKELKMSSRGIDTNVQIIAEAVGGGGHFSSSAATSKEPIKVFSDNLIHSIVSEKERIK